MLVKLYKIGEVRFRLFYSNVFHVKAKNERFTAAGSHCHQNLKFRNFKSSFGRLLQQVAPKSVPHVLHDYFLNSTNQIIDLWCCRSRSRRSFLNPLVTAPITLGISRQKGPLLSDSRYFRIGKKRL